MRTGARVIPLLGATSRDSVQFPDPDRLDCARRGGAHVAFGAGPHHCPGAPPARLEATIALSRLIVRLPGLRPAPEDGVWRSHPTVRVLASLPVVWDRDSAGNTETG